MMRARVASGSEAVAEAVIQVRPDVVSGCPVTPVSPVLDHIAAHIAAGRLDCEFISAESAHSAMSAALGAAAAGGRAFVVSASQAIPDMLEVMHIAAALRLPIIAAVANTALSAPVNIHADHSDAMILRDSGWIQLFSENGQEMYDNIIQAWKIAEHPDVKTPVLVCMDGFITSHAISNFAAVESPEAEDFLGKSTPAYSLLDNEHPVTVGSLHTPDSYFEQKVHQLQGIENSRTVIRDVGKEFGRRFGRFYGYFEGYKLDDAEYAAVFMNSAAGTAKAAVDELRARGEKVGMLKVRMFRPFPERELRERLAELRAVAVFDRSVIPGASGGPLFHEVRNSLFELERRPTVLPCIYGLGGRNINGQHIQDIFALMKEKSAENLKAEPRAFYINLRGAV